MEMILLKLFDKIKHLLWQLPNNAFNHYKESDGYINMQSVCFVNSNLMSEKSYKYYKKE